MPKKSPLKESIEEISEKWPAMELRQKIGFTAGLATTLSAVFRPVVELHQGERETPTRSELVANIALDFRDFIDGKLVRFTDAVTLLGKMLDPIVDKADFFIQEFFHYRRGNLPLEHLILRWGRDTVVTATRMWAKIETENEIDISAGWAGKSSTTLRSISLRSTGTSIENKSDEQRTHQKIATGALMASGVYNVFNLYKGVQAHKKAKKVAR